MNNPLQPCFKIRVMNGKSASAGNLKSLSVGVAADNSFIDIERCVASPVVYEEKASLMSALSFTVDKCADVLLYYFYMGQSIVFYGGHYADDSSGMKLIFSGTITRIRTSFSESGVVSVGIECMNYGFNKLAKNYKNFVYPDINSNRKFAQKATLTVSDIVRGIADDNGIKVGNIELSPEAKALKFTENDMKYQKDTTDWKFLNMLAQDCGCNVWLSFEDGEEYLNFVSMGKNFRKQSEISFLFPLKERILGIKDSEIIKADNPEYDRLRLLRDVQVDEDISAADAITRSATYFDKETGEYKEAMAKVETDKDGNTVTTFYELDEDRVQYVEDNFPDIADKIRDSSPTSLKWGSESDDNNPNCARFYYKAIKRYSKDTAVFDKAFFGITVTGTCNQDLNIESQKVYKIRGILSYHSKDLESSFFLRGLKHIWGSDGNWTELDFIR